MRISVPRVYVFEFNYIASRLNCVVWILPRNWQVLRERLKKISQGSLYSESKFVGEFPKFRIELATDEPIIPGFFLERQERNPVWIHFKYVKLPSFCIQCGRMNHELKHCDGKKATENNMYGKWIRAEDRSWNIPVWSDNPQTRHKFKIISMVVPEKVTVTA